MASIHAPEGIPRMSLARLVPRWRTVAVLAKLPKPPGPLWFACDALQPMVGTALLVRECSRRFHVRPSLSKKSVLGGRPLSPRFFSSSTGWLRCATCGHASTSSCNDAPRFPQQPVMRGVNRMPLHRMGRLTFVILSCPVRDSLTVNLVCVWWSVPCTGRLTPDACGSRTCGSSAPARLVWLCLTFDEGGGGSNILLGGSTSSLRRPCRVCIVLMR